MKHYERLTDHIADMEERLQKLEKAAPKNTILRRSGETILLLQLLLFAINICLCIRENHQTKDK